MSNGCPRCSAQIFETNDDGSKWFDCDAYMDEDGMMDDAPMPCLLRQLARKDRELEEAKAEIRETQVALTTHYMEQLGAKQLQAELEQSRLREAQALAKLADLAHAARHVKLKAIGVTTADTKYRLEQKEDLLCEAITHLDTILTDTPEVLAVAEADDVFIDDYGEKYIRVFVGADFFGVPGTVIVLRRDERED